MRRRRGASVVAIAVAAPLAAGVAYAARSAPGATATPPAGVTTGTAVVTRGTLTQTVQLSGSLRYTGAYTVAYPGEPGVLTAAPAPGATIGRGAVLFRVSDRPVRLLLGAVPVYRDLRSGMTDGPDVRQLERNLVALGFDPHHRITVDRHFSAATTAAIRRWEASWGRRSYQRTGRITQGQVVFLPSPLRVADVPVRLGSAVAPRTTVLTGTSATRAVVAEVDTAQAGTLHVNDQVEVSLPDTGPVPGRVASIGAVATTSAAEGQNTATVPVTVTVRLPRGFTLDQAPATVDVVTGRRPGVLLAPIAALLARPGGGYQVRLAGGGLVTVEPGRFDEGTGRVEIVRGLTEGQPVEVPAG
ncbi:HlyD family efflux transporter periplasmic adaptor subunit [Actinoplanes bogorensis]|uniref:HlyD family efflux transporter periplasmic adaptor subunit n=1 Tax=Paractinoplanes bogorensis TaxID=1610840 RepID=A0ABS5YXA3_9ACTN|nr:peptidoglycan-binding domain-containing protein [Actinoplanes bogorensis]MBU2668067.1 HlyD family efflux transporter periplasmic adaptor subunit [Actinoplanes bogorensis]